jgi:hypothetical protein
MSNQRRKGGHCKKLFVVPFGHSPPRGLSHTGNIRVCRKARIPSRSCRNSRARRSRSAQAAVWSLAAPHRGSRAVRSHCGASPPRAPPSAFNMSSAIPPPSRDVSPSDLPSPLERPSISLPSGASVYEPLLRPPHPASPHLPPAGDRRGTRASGCADRPRPPRSLPGMDR